MGWLPVSAICLLILAHRQLPCQVPDPHGLVAPGEGPCCPKVLGAMPANKKKNKKKQFEKEAWEVAEDLREAC